MRIAIKTKVNETKYKTYNWECIGVDSYLFDGLIIQFCIYKRKRTMIYSIPLSDIVNIRLAGKSAFPQLDNIVCNNLLRNVTKSKLNNSIINFNKSSK